MAFARKRNSFANWHKQINSPIKINTMRELRTWDFVEKNYPDYDHAEEIAHEGDLSKLVNVEYEEGDCASQLLEREFEGIEDPEIINAHKRALADIYEKSIESLLRSANEQRAIAEQLLQSSDGRDKAQGEGMLTVLNLIS